MRVRWTQYALDQLQAVVDRLQEQRKAAARQRILDHLMRRVRALGDLPRSAPRWRPAGDDTFRRVVVEDYVLLYRIVEDEDSIYILAVRHGRQHPLDPSDVPRS